MTNSSDRNYAQDTAPVRANKAKGLKSQKQLRDEQYAEFNEDVKKLAKK